MRTPLLIITTALLLASCSSSGGAPAASSPHGTPSRPTAPSSSAFTPTPGQDAATLATHIPGCTGVLAGSVGGGRKSGMRSTASCTLAGHLVIIDSYAAGADATISNSLVTRRTWYAYGDAWTEILGDPGETAKTTTLQMQLTNAAGALLEQSIDGDAPAPASLDVQKSTAVLVAKALSGQASAAH